LGDIGARNTIEPTSTMPLVIADARAEMSVYARTTA
jgi:hypothetical protein